MEYPLRPPVFSLNLYSGLREDNYSEVDCSKWHNELRAIEAEVSTMLFNEIYMSIYAYVIIRRVANQSVSFTLPCKGFCHEDFLIFVPFSLNFLGNKYSPDFMLVLHSLHFSKTISLLH